jgi:catechol 2,3-dioxygenase-like lactoylglutathione lyase family enzyme
MSDFHVQRLDHVHVAVKDRASATAWYGHVLGLRKHYDYTEHGDPLGPVVLSSDEERWPDTFGWFSLDLTCVACGRLSPELVSYETM